MVDTPSQKEAAPKERVAAILYFSSIYFVAVGALYLWGYWSTFHVNILEYLGLADIIKSTAFPVASAFGSLALGIVIGELTTPKSIFPPGGGSHTRAATFLQRHEGLVGTAYGAGCLALFFFAPPGKWLVLPLLVALPLTIAAKRFMFLETFLPNDSARTVVLFVGITLPMFAYGHGRTSSQDVLVGNAFEYAISAVEDVPVERDAPPLGRLRYLGHAGDFIFLWEPIAGATVVAKVDAAKSLILKHYSGPPTSLDSPAAQSPALRQAAPSSPTSAMAPATPSSSLR